MLRQESLEEPSCEAWIFRPWTKVRFKDRLGKGTRGRHEGRPEGRSNPRLLHAA